MTKQEVIKRGIAMELQGADARAGGNKCIVDFYPIAERIMLKQSSQDVAIKVEEELHIEIVGDITLAGAGLLTKEIKDLLSRLGYTAWKPLIKEVKDGITD